MNIFITLLINFVSSACSLLLAHLIKSCLDQYSSLIIRKWIIPLLPCLALISTLYIGHLLEIFPKYTAICFATVYEISVFTNICKFIKLETLKEKVVHLICSVFLIIVAIVASRHEKSKLNVYVLYYAAFLTQDRLPNVFSQLLLQPKEEKIKILKSIFSFSKDGLTMIVITAILGAVFLFYLGSILQSSQS